MALPPPGTHLFLPSLLTHVRRTAPGFPLEPVIVQVLLICIISGHKNLILRTRDEDIPLVSKLTTLALHTIFGYNSHRLKCHSGTANQSPSEFLRSFFCAGSAVATPPTDNNLAGSLHKHRHRRVSNSRNSAGKLPIAPSTSISTARSRRTSLSRSTSHPVESKPSIATLGRPQSDSWDPDSKPSLNAEVYSQRPNPPAGTRTDTSVPTLASSVKTHFRNFSRGSTEALKLPSAVVVSGLEFAGLPSQKAVLRTLAERKFIVSDGGIFGHDQDGLTVELPDGFFIVYVCRSDPRDRPPIYKSLLDRFAMSSSVDVGPQTRLAMRQFRPPSSPSTTPSSLHTCVPSAAFPTLHSSIPLPGPSTPVETLASPAIPSALLHRLEHLCATQARIRPSLDVYLADLFSATRHYGPLDSMMLTARARQDAEVLIQASRVLGTDHTGAELIKEHAERSRETDSTSSTYPHSQPSVASTSSDALVDDLEMREPLGGSSPPSTEQLNLDVSEADIARMFPRAVSHRIRVRDSPFDEILSSAVCGAIRTPGNEPHEKETLVQWERETVKDILVHILSEV
ncbi:hypothetical protein EV363DRAFT_1257588 [Boletus edulis]|nr:hypothetical protein EV363DRAFT_1257588 [Boletus edulis]